MTKKMISVATATTMMTVLGLALVGCGRAELSPRLRNSITSDGRCTMKFVEDSNKLASLLTAKAQKTDQASIDEVAKECETFYKKHSEEVLCKVDDSDSEQERLTDNRVFKARCDDAISRKSKEEKESEVADATRAPASLFAALSIHSAKNLTLLDDQDVRPEIPNECSKEFTTAYKRVENDRQTVLEYGKKNQMPPNLDEANDGCEVLETKFEYTECAQLATVRGEQVIVNTATTDFQKACEAVRNLIVLRDSQTPPDTSVGATPIGKLDLARLKITVKNASEVQRAIDYPKSAFVINGKVLSLSEMIMDKSPVRCTFDKVGEKSLKVLNDQVLNIKGAERAYIAGHKYGYLILADADLTLDCTNVSPNAVTLNDLKKAFANLLEIAY